LNRDRGVTRARWLKLKDKYSICTCHGVSEHYIRAKLLELSKLACVYTKEFFSTSHLIFSEHTRDSRCLHVVAFMLIKKICIFREVKILESKKGETISVFINYIINKFFCACVHVKFLLYIFYIIKLFTIYIHFVLTFCN